MGTDTKIALTYEALYDVLLREKQRETLQELDPSFWTNSLAYLREKQAMLDDTRNKVDIFSATERDSIHTQLRNVRKLLRDIYERREKKIIDIALNKSRTGSKIIDLANMLDIEKQMFEAIVNEMNFFRQGLLHNILDMRDPSMWLESEERHSAPFDNEPTIPHGMTRLIITQDVAQFIGKELEVYGPFRTGETTVLPSEIADILVAQGSATAHAMALDSDPVTLPEQQDPGPIEPEYSDPALPEDDPGEISDPPAGMG